MLADFNFDKKCKLRIQNKNINLKIINFELIYELR